eukprot:3625877-Amphidinium_carterae.1
MLGLHCARATTTDIFYVQRELDQISLNEDAARCGPVLVVYSCPSSLFSTIVCRRQQRSPLELFQIASDSIVNLQYRPDKMTTILIPKALLAAKYAVVQFISHSAATFPQRD